MKVYVEKKKKMQEIEGVKTGRQCENNNGKEATEMVDRRKRRKICEKGTVEKLQEETCRVKGRNEHEEWSGESNNRGET